MPETPDLKRQIVALCRFSPVPRLTHCSIASICQALVKFCSFTTSPLGLGPFPCYKLRLLLSSRSQLEHVWKWNVLPVVTAAARTPDARTPQNSTEHHRTPQNFTELQRNSTARTPAARTFLQKNSDTKGCLTQPKRTSAFHLYLVSTSVPSIS